MVSTVLKQHLSAKQQAVHQVEQAVYLVKYSVETFVLMVIAAMPHNALPVSFALIIHAYVQVVQYYVIVHVLLATVVLVLNALLVKFVLTTHVHAHLEQFL